MTDDRTADFEFWYDFASPYAYLAAARIEALAAARPVRLLWRPLLLGPILKRRPGTASPFQEAGPEEARYRRRDIERHCALYGVPLRWPSTYPRGSLLAVRIALLADDEGWSSAFTRTVFQASFAEDRDIAAAPVIVEILVSLGREPGPILARATAPETKNRLIAQTDRAIAAGIFGVPSFVTGTELFWGNDRLEQALDWAEKDRD
jgi:2-hydroxychromene-2-carboxylate isomerase